MRREQSLTFALPHYFGTARIGLLLGGQAFMTVSGTCFGSWVIGLSPSVFGGFGPVLVLLSAPAAALACLVAMLVRQPRPRPAGVCGLAAAHPPDSPASHRAVRLRVWRRTPRRLLPRGGLPHAEREQAATLLRPITDAAKGR